MARKTDGEKIDELVKFAAELNERVDNVRGELRSLHEEFDKAVLAFNDLRTGFASLGNPREDNRAIHDRLEKTAESIGELKTKLALVDDRLTEIKKSAEEAANRRWSLLPPVIGGIIGGLLTLGGQLLLRYVFSGSTSP